jgi:type II secretory pathway component PulF
MSDPLPPLSLSAREAESLVLSVAQLAGAHLPLAEGLRAAAGEAASRRMSAALRRLAAAIESGRSLDQALRECGPRVPPFLAGFLKAAERTGKLGAVLTEWVENQWAVRARWREVTAALAYPAIALAMTLVVFLFLAVTVTQPFQEMMRELGLKLPLPTLVFFWLANVAVPVTITSLVTLVVGLVVLRFLGGRAALSQLMAALPITGKLWYWSGAAEGLRGVGLLVENRIPLPEALELAADGIADAQIGQACRQLGIRVAEGESLWEALLRTRSFPMAIIPIIRQGEQQGTLDGSLRTAAMLLEERVHNRSTLVIQILPPLIFLLVAFMIGMIVTALFLPMVGLVRGLA